MEEGGYKSIQLRQQSVSITHAQLLLLHSTEVVVVESSESAIIVPIAAEMLLNTEAGAYGNGTGKVLGLRYTGNSVFVTGTAALDVAAALAAAKKSFGQFAIPVGTGIPYVDIDTSDLINIDLVARFVSGTALTGGNAANTLTILVQYIEIPIA